MSALPESHHRRSIRLQGYDYSQSGAYFITLCTHERQNLFGEIRGGEMILNEIGIIVREEWEKSAVMRAEIELGEYVVMPNHVHAIVWISSGNDLRRGDRPVATLSEKPNGPAAKSIGACMAGFKSAVTIRINQKRKTPGLPVWQRNYWEHIIRNEISYKKIAEYVQNNPARWEYDELNRRNER
jgi:putative transposase